MQRVVITGMGVVSPIGIGIDAFFSGLRQSLCGIAPISVFDASGFEVRLAAEVRGPLPALSAEEACIAERDRKVGFAVQAAHEALAMAGVPRLEKEHLLHIGTSLESFHFANFSFPPHNASSADLAAHLAIQAWRLPLDAALQLIVRRFGRPGQALNNCSACAVGLQTIGQAFQAVREGRHSLALAGGFDSMINPLGVGGFQLLGAPSVAAREDGLVCRPFDVNRSGLVLGEGAAFVVLEPRDKALAEGKTLYGEIRGYGSSLDAYGLSAPEPQGQGAVRAMRLALQDAACPQQAVDHINAHGTGTLLNDPVEAKAIREVFAGCWENIPVTATKAMTGHSIAAAGAIELMACLYTLGEQTIPPNIGLDKVGEGCELMHVAAKPLAHPVERILTNSFGFGGQNATLIVQRG